MAPLVVPSWYPWYTLGGVYLAAFVPLGILWGTLGSIVYWVYLTALLPLGALRGTLGSILRTLGCKVGCTLKCSQWSPWPASLPWEAVLFLDLFCFCICVYISYSYSYLISVCICVFYFIVYINSMGSFLPSAANSIQFKKIIEEEKLELDFESWPAVNEGEWQFLLRFWPFIVNRGLVDCLNICLISENITKLEV